MRRSTASRTNSSSSIIVMRTELGNAELGGKRGGDIGRDEAGYFEKFSSSSLAFAMRSWAISSSPCEVARCGHARARRVHVCAISRRYLIKSEFISDFDSWTTLDARNKRQRIPAGDREHAASSIPGAPRKLVICGQFFAFRAAARGATARGYAAARMTRGGRPVQRRNACEKVLTSA